MVKLIVANNQIFSAKICIFFYSNNFLHIFLQKNRQKTFFFAKRSLFWRIFVNFAHKIEPMNDQRPSFLRNTPPVVLNLIIINAIVWIASVALLNKTDIRLTDLLGMHYFMSEKFRLYQLFTYMFLHDTSSMWHLFCNMFGVYMFGCALEQVWGSRKFLFYYMVSGGGAAIVQQLCWAIDYWNLTEAMNAAVAQGSTAVLGSYEEVLRNYFRFGALDSLSVYDVLGMKNALLNLPTTIGASGALFGVLLAFGWLFPDVKMFLLFVPIPIPARIFVGLYAVLELFLGIADFRFDSVAHFAHLGGMIFGFALLFYWYKKGKLFNR